MFGVMLFERVGDVLKKDEPENDVLVLGCVHVAAELIGSGPHRRFKPKVRTVSLVLFFLRSCHDSVMKLFRVPGALT
jgi:hypothetical protein